MSASRKIKRAPKRLPRDPEFGTGTVFRRYARISLRNDEAIDRQLDSTDLYGRARRWIAADHPGHVDDGISAYDDSVVRPGFDEMIADAEAGLFDVIVAWDLDRLCRRSEDLKRLLDLWHDYGVPFVTVNGGISPISEHGELVVKILTAVAEMEVAHKRERQLFAWRHRRATDEKAGGQRPNWPYRPFGFLRDGRHHEIEAPLVAEAYDRFERGETLSQIAGWLGVVLGLRTPRGKAWSAQTVGKLLEAERNAGYVTSTADGIQRRGAWEAIVSLDRVEAVKAKRSGRHSGGARSGRTRTHDYLLAGHLACGRCGARLWTQPARSGLRYICPPSKQGKRPDGKTPSCGSLGVLAGPVEDHVDETVIAFLSIPENREAIIGAQEGSDVAEAQATLAEAAASRDRVERMIARGKVSEAKGDLLLAEIDEEDAEARAIIARQAPAVVEALIELEDETEVGEWWLSISKPKRAALLRDLVSPVVVAPRESRTRGRFDPTRVRVEIAPAWRVEALAA